MHDWVNSAGQGVMESNPEGFPGIVNKHCQYYYHIHDVMVDRANSKALVINEELYYGNDESVGNQSGASIPSTSSGNDFVEVMPQPKKKKKVFPSDAYI